MHSLGNNKISDWLTSLPSPVNLLLPSEDYHYKKKTPRSYPKT